MDRSSKNVSSAAHSLGSPAPVGICRPTVLSFVFNEALCFFERWGIIGRLGARVDGRGAPRLACLGATEVRTGTNEPSLAVGPDQA